LEKKVIHLEFSGPEKTSLGAEGIPTGEFSLGGDFLQYVVFRGGGRGPKAFSGGRIRGMGFFKRGGGGLGPPSEKKRGTGKLEGGERGGRCFRGVRKTRGPRGGGRRLDFKGAEP